MNILICSADDPFKKSYPTLLLLSSLVSDHHNVHISTFNKIKIENIKKYDIVGLSFITEKAPYAYNIADKIRRQGVSVVLGGWHASALPEEAKQHADAVVIGEAEISWPQLIKDFENGKLKSFYREEKPVDPQEIPILNSTLAKKHNTSLIATRGCPMKCEFCAISNRAFGNVLRMRPIDHVIEEIKAIKSTYFVFNDASLTINPNYTKELFKKMNEVGLNKRFNCSGNVNILAKDEELIRLSKKAGCVGWFIGFESVSQESIDSIGKSNIVKGYNLAIKKIHDYGMYVYGSFVLGFDTDKLDIFDKTYEFAISNNIDIVAPKILTPFPGTPLFQRLEEEGRIFDKDWSKYDFCNVVFQPKNMTPYELYEGFIELLNKLYTSKNVFFRIGKSLNLGLYPFLSIFVENIRYIGWGGSRDARW